MTNTVGTESRARVCAFLIPAGAVPLLVVLAIAGCGKATGSDGTGGTGGSGGSSGGGMGGSVAGTSGGGRSGSPGTGGLGGTTGTAGTFGGTGTGLFTGTAGTGAACNEAPPQGCGAALCGNGTRDTCQYPTGPGTCPMASVTEWCDGTDFGGVSCAAWGFGAGTLTCRSNCQVDTSTCRICGEGPGIASCGMAPFTADPSRMGIAATDTEVAVAWIQQPFGTTPALYFSRLSAALELIGTTHFDDAKLGGSLENVVLAPLASGWVAAGWANSEVFIRGIDASGRDLGRLTVDTIGVDDLVALPTLARRRDGGPLLVWQSKTALRVAVISGDGRSVSAPRELPAGGTLSGWMSAVYAGGAFYVSVLVGQPFPTAAEPIRILRVEADGTPGAAVDALPGVKADSASLVEGADDLRIVYKGAIPGATSASDQGLQFQRVGAAGQPLLSAPVLIPEDGYVDWAIGTAFGGDTVVMASGGTDTRLSVTRVGSDGTIVTPTRTVAGTPPPSSFFSQGLARRGPDVVVAWAQIQKIMLARVTP